MANVDILELFHEKDFVKICAPMVRYSKYVEGLQRLYRFPYVSYLMSLIFFYRLPFRILARQYGCDLCYTPMIMADSFVQSAKARSNEFTTCVGLYHETFYKTCFPCINNRMCPFFF